MKASRRACIAATSAGSICFVPVSGYVGGTTGAGLSSPRRWRRELGGAWSLVIESLVGGWRPVGPVGPVGSGRPRSVTERTAQTIAALRGSVVHTVCVGEAVLAAGRGCAIDQDALQIDDDPLHGARELWRAALKAGDAVGGSFEGDLVAAPVDRGACGRL